MKLKSFKKNMFTSLFSKKIAVLVALCFVLSGALFSAVQAEFYPDRQPFDYNKACDPSDNDPYDRCGSLTGPVFNSFINTPYYGDERQFTDAKRTDQTTGDVYKNVLPDVTDGASEVKIRVYVHNNANTALNADGKGIAKNTMVKIGLPTGTDSEMRARGYISADNAPLVEDTVDFTSTKKFRMEYVPGSATLFNGGAFKDGKKLDDSIVTTGALIGDDALDGDLPGCFEYQTTVFITVKIIPESAPAARFNKLVKNEDANAQWAETTTVKPGDKVNWLVEFANTSTQDLTEVSINDNLPPHVRVVPGSIRYIDAAQDVPQSDGTFFTTGGIAFGTWKPGGGFYIRFQTEALADFEECQVTVRNVAYYTTAQSLKGEDYADVVIKKSTCAPTTTPSYTCESFTLGKNAVKLNEKFTSTVKVTAQNGAQFKLATFTFGDEGTNGTKFVTNSVNNGVVTAEHSYATAGDYAPRVKLEFTVNGETKTVEDAKCAAQIKVEKPVLAATTPTTLPKTGASEIAGIFSAVTVAGAAMHRRSTIKKRRR